MINLINSIKRNVMIVVTKIKEFHRSEKSRDIQKAIIVAMTASLVNFIACSTSMFDLFSRFAISCSAGFVIWVCYLYANMSMVSSWTKENIRETQSDQFDTMRIYIEILITIVVQTLLSIINNVPFGTAVNLFNFVLGIFSASYITDQVMKKLEKKMSVLH